MSNINKLLNDILTLKKFEAVRNAICEAIKEVYKSAIQKGNSSMEIAQARNGYKSLKDRIEALEKGEDTILPGEIYEDGPNDDIGGD